VSGAVFQTELTPLSYLRRSAEVYPDKTAIVYGERRYSYAEFAEAATRVARALRASGIAPGDRVAYLLPNLPEMLVAHFAVPLAGAVLVAINTRLSTDEVRYILDHSGAKLLVVDSVLAATVAPVAEQLATVTEIVTVVDPAAPGTDHQLLHAVPARQRPRQNLPEQRDIDRRTLRPNPIGRTPPRKSPSPALMMKCLVSFKHPVRGDRALASEFLRAGGLPLQRHAARAVPQLVNSSYSTRYRR